MAERTLTVRILGDDADLRRALGRSSKEVQGFGVQVQGLGRQVAKGFLVAGGAAAGADLVVRGISKSISEASNLNEQTAKSIQVFGDSSQAIQDWARTTASSIGVSQAAALEATGTFGNLFRTVGLAQKPAADMSKALVTLASDLASFNNADPSDVLLAIRSGLIGEAEPMRRYGALLSEARVQQQAMADTGKKNAKQLTDTEKVYARYEIILRDTKAAQGDFLRTREGLANQQRILAAQVSTLAGNFGQLLIPKITETVTAVNDLIGAFQRLEGAIPDLPGGGGGGFFGELFKSLPAQLEDRVDDLKRLREDIDLVLQGKGFEPRPKKFAEAGKATEDDIKAYAGHVKNSLPVLAGLAPDVLRAVNTADAALETAREIITKQERAADKRKVEAAGKAWNEFVQGMGLKLDTARLTETTNDDLAALRELERAIRRRIEAEGRTFKLVQLLTQTRLQINDVLRGQAQDAAQAASDAWNATIDKLDLGLDMARATKGFNDDLRALRAIEAAILKQIQAEGRTTELLRQLFENRQAQAETLRDQRNAAAFEALGLTAEGEKPVASGAALLKRARSLQAQLKGTPLDASKTGDQLRKIVAYLKKNFRKAGREVRQAILDMLNDISSALDEDGGGSLGTQTAFQKRGVGKLIKGLGLTPAQVKEIRQRFSQFGARDLAGATRAGARGAGTSPPPSGPRPDDQPLVVHIYIDGREVEAVVTKRQQKTRGRNRPQRRGTHAGR